MFHCCSFQLQFLYVKYTTSKFRFIPPPAECSSRSPPPKCTIWDPGEPSNPQGIWPSQRPGSLGITITINSCLSLQVWLISTELLCDMLQPNPICRPYPVLSNPLRSLPTVSSTFHISLSCMDIE